MAMSGALKIFTKGAVVGLLTILTFQATASAGSGKDRFGKEHPELLKGRWILDLSESSLGSDPYEQFDAWTLTFSKVTTTFLVWTSNATIHGNALAFSWAGPIDGSPKPLIGTEGSDAYRWRKNTLIRRSDLGQGERKLDTVTLSQDGETMTIRDRSTTPSGATRAILVLHRQH
jgi:hypothetical protein